MNPKAVIFDLDGTILDNEWVYDQAFCYVLKELGISCEQLNHTPGIGIRENWEKMAKDLGITKDPQELSTQTQDFYLEHLQEVEVREGVRETLYALRRGRIKTILASSNTTAVAIRVLETLKLDQLFDSKTFGDEVEKKKPAPDIFLKAMDKANLLPREVVIIEDSPAGIEAGKSAGAEVIALKTDWFTRSQLSRADFVAKNFNYITNLIQHGSSFREVE